MNTLFLANAGGAAGGNWMMIILFIILIAFTYFGMIRPQKKQQQQRMEMMDKLKKGDGVILVDGLHAKVDKVNADKTIVVDADGIYLTFERMAVRRIIPAQAPAENETPVEATDSQKPEEKSVENESAKESTDSSEAKDNKSADTESTEDK